MGERGRKRIAGQLQGPVDHRAPKMNTSAAILDFIAQDNHPARVVVDALMIMPTGLIVVKAKTVVDYLMAKKSILKMKPEAMIEQYVQR